MARKFEFTQVFICHVPVCLPTYYFDAASAPNHFHLQVIVCWSLPQQREGVLLERSPLSCLHRPLHRAILPVFLIFFLK